MKEARDIRRLVKEARERRRLVTCDMRFAKPSRMALRRQDASVLQGARVLQGASVLQYE